jgi:hypothetical protein
MLTTILTLLLAQAPGDLVQVLPGEPCPNCRGIIVARSLYATLPDLTRAQEAKAAGEGNCHYLATAPTLRVWGGVPIRALKIGTTALVTRTGKGWVYVTVRDGWNRGYSGYMVTRNLEKVGELPLPEKPPAPPAPPPPGDYESDHIREARERAQAAVEAHAARVRYQLQLQKTIEAKRGRRARALARAGW